jgi:iron complex transport system substrate-binding protein
VRKHETKHIDPFFNNSVCCSRLVVPSTSIAPAAETQTFTDDLGGTIELTGQPQRIVSLSPSMTEILFTIGAGEQVVGRDEFSIYPEEALEVTSIGAMWEELPSEAILALEPDLVLAAQIISEDQVAALRNLGLNVYWQANPLTYEELFENLRDIARMTGHEAETETLITDLAARVEAVQEKTATVSERPLGLLRAGCDRPVQPLDGRFRHLHRLHHPPGWRDECGLGACRAITPSSARNS